MQWSGGKKECEEETELCTWLNTQLITNPDVETQVQDQEWHVDMSNR